MQLCVSTTITQRSFTYYEVKANNRRRTGKLYQPNEWACLGICSHGLVVLARIQMQVLVQCVHVLVNARVYTLHAICSWLVVCAQDFGAGGKAASKTMPSSDTIKKGASYYVADGLVPVPRETPAIEHSRQLCIRFCERSCTVPVHVLCYWE